MLSSMLAGLVNNPSLCLLECYGSRSHAKPREEITINHFLTNSSSDLKKWQQLLKLRLLRCVLIMSSQMEMSEPDDGKPIIQQSFKSGFQLSTRRRILLLSTLVIIFIFPVVLVLSLDLPLVVASDKARTGIISHARLLPSWMVPAGLREPTIPTIAIDKLVNTGELSLNTSLAISSTPTVREYQFNISQAYAAPDGFQKLMILVNGQSPGPLIEANVGDIVRVLVHNELGNMSTSIHWHGIDQRNTTWMDGVTGVTQCAIPPGESFTYEFQISDQRGTFWYHAHTTMQYTDGLFGPLVRDLLCSFTLIHVTHELSDNPRPK